MGQVAPLSSAAWHPTTGYARKWCNWCKSDAYTTISGQNYPDGRWDEMTASIPLPTSIDGMLPNVQIGTSEFTRPTHGEFGLGAGTICQMQFEVRVPAGKTLSISGNELGAKSVLKSDPIWEEFRPDKNMPCHDNEGGCKSDWSDYQKYNRFGCMAGTHSTIDVLIDGIPDGKGRGFGNASFSQCWNKQQHTDDFGTSTSKAWCIAKCEATAGCDSLWTYSNDASDPGSCCIRKTLHPSKTAFRCLRLAPIPTAKGGLCRGLKGIDCSVSRELFR